MLVWNVVEVWLVLMWKVCKSWVEGVELMWGVEALGLSCPCAERLAGWIKMWRSLFDASFPRA